MKALAWESVPAVPPVDADVCLVWWTLPAWVRPALLTVLDRGERGRLRRFRHAADRSRFAAGVVVTRLVLGALLGMPASEVPLDRACGTCGEPHGPPRLTGPHPPFQLSISHARDRVVVAVTRAVGVGVDVEWAVPGWKVGDLGADVLAREEASMLARADADRRMRGLVSYWTRKEAVTKATGDGLRAELRRITVTAPAVPPRLLRWTDRPDMPTRMTLRTLHAGPGYAACLALIDQPAATVRELSAATILAP